MHKVWIAILSLVLAAPAFANREDSLFDQITMQLAAEQWVTTKTALVIVSVNAAVNDNALEAVQDELLHKLSGVSNQGDWHIVSYDRSLDKSGLEHLQIQTQARLPIAALTGIRDKVKAISKPGETFSVDDIQFTPSAQELRDANIVLRNDIYQQVKEELARIVKLYPDEKYSLHAIDFTLGMMPPGPMPMNAMAVRAGGNNFAVGDKIVLRATVVFGAMSEPVLAKNPHL